MQLVESLGGRQIVLCTGPGGVGKTTSSAAIALAAARAGKRVLVLTIDPARRLADALGVGLDNAPRRIEDAVLHTAGVSMSGELWALMLDPVRTFDDLIMRLAPNPAVAARLLHNVVYRQISRALAGTLEYTAVEKLYDLRARYSFDLIVVDTPPSKNVLDFIEAPEWLLRFLDERVLKWFLLLDPTAPSGGFGRSLLRRTGRVVWDVLARIFGDEFLGDIAEFMRGIETMTTEFSRRAESIQALLRSPQSIFLVVTTPDSFVVADAIFLQREIARRGITFGGFVVNRVQAPSGLANPEATARLLAQSQIDEPLMAGLAQKLVAACGEVDAQARHDAEAIAALRRESGWSGCVAVLARQVEEINDLGALNRLAARL